MTYCLWMPLTWVLGRTLAGLLLGPWCQVIGLQTKPSIILHLRSSRALSSLLVWHNVALFSDSIVVVRVLQKLYTKSQILRASLACKVILLRRLGVKLQVHHTEGKLN